MSTVGAPTVLVADDEAEFRTMLAELLRGHGFEVAEAANGLETLLHVKRHRPRHVVLDVHMPRLGGLDALRRIRAFDPSIGVVIVTGVPDEELARDAGALGAVAFFSKPLDTARLVATLRGTPRPTRATPDASVVPPATRLETAPSGAEAAGPGQRAGRMLVVDDETDVRETVAALLANAGYEVLTAGDGAAAVRAVVTRAPDVVLLDIEMPTLGGIEALAKIRAIAPEVRVVMLSGVTDEEVARRALAFGAFDYIAKPFDTAHLLQTIETILVLRALEAEPPTPGSR